MPNRDGTGPEGKGSMTGRRRGKCAGAEATTCTRGKGRGRDCGRSLGIGRSKE